MIRDKFWEKFKLNELNETEWEALCDGCGRCCLVKLQDEDTNEILYTSISCKLLDPETCRCTDYKNRMMKVPNCMKLTPNSITEFGYLPETCGYRKVYEGRPLEDWHPLISGDKNSVHKSGVSVAYKVYPEHKIEYDDIQDFIIEFDD
ncbi:flagellin N-methylase [Bacteriovorax sp. BSW11_IV]|uniref:YcgN family cysteine cluster protein n=1 Tax=Bacteriovorax sp. BSW11_IV TaxID=1353529 RepID=UPI00038A4B9F|nr:YcgN family cysteine cluster protein [Bacteriovorax sp. BSW11_IV]EQC47833.1 flagellin N-methylase [Bacteriovorax sp. BSW11_IV]